MITRQEFIRQRKIRPDDFSGARFVPSQAVRAGFSKLFSLIYENFERIFSITRISWESDRMEMVLVHSDSSESIYLSLRENAGICEGKFCTNHLCVGVHHIPQNMEIVRFLSALSIKGKDIGMDTLLRFLCNDPKAKAEYHQLFWKSTRPPASIIQDWGHSRHKVRFVVHEGLLRNIDQSLDFTFRELHIHHSERECKGISPNVSGGNEYRFFNFPGEYYDHTFDKYFYLPKGRRSSIFPTPSTGSDIFTDLDEQDIIMGNGTRKLSALLDAVVDQVNNSTDLQFASFNCCCVPRITGDDIYSVLEKAKEKMKIPFVFRGQLERTPFEQKIYLLESYLAQLDMPDISRQKGVISLFGYHENKYLQHLSDLLREQGVQIGSIFVPTININLLPALGESELFVFSPNRLQGEIFEYPFGQLGVKSIAPKFPYGIGNTDQWFVSIFSAIERQNSIEVSAEMRRQYTCLVQHVQKQGYRAGLVFSNEQEMQSFLDPDHMNNVDVIEFLEEMGFGIDIFFYDPNEDLSLGLLTRTIGESRIEDEKCRVYFFQDENHFYSLLERTSPHILYSDIYFDDRMFRLGINQFNISHFSAGYVGAIETIRRLVRLCEMGYFRKFASYL